jgi:hypothetical protein
MRIYNQQQPTDFLFVLEILNQVENWLLFPEI